MLKRTVLWLCLTLVIVGSVIAQEKQKMGVEDLVICTAVENRQPAGVDSVFSNTVDRLYCFTTVTGAEDTTSVYQVWQFKDEVKAKIKLKIGAKSWRTWSSKKIVKEWVGPWSVEVVTKDGDVLARKMFRVKE